MRAKWAPSTGSGARATMTTTEDAETGRSDGSRRDIDVRRARGDVERAWTTRETRACETGEGWVRRRARARARGARARRECDRHGACGRASVRALGLKRTTAPRSVARARRSSRSRPRDVAHEKRALGGSAASSSSDPTSTVAFSVAF